jgi:hypothetical protein
LSFSVTYAHTQTIEIYNYTVYNNIYFTHLYPEVGIVKRWCNGVTNEQLFFSFKTITSYKSNGSKPVKNVIGRYKINLEALKSYNIIKQLWI